MAATRAKRLYLLFVLFIALSTASLSRSQTLTCTGNGCPYIQTGGHTDSGFSYFDFTNSASNPVIVTFQLTPLGVGGSCSSHQLTVNPNSTNSTTGAICGSSYQASLVLPTPPPVQPSRPVPPGMVPWPPLPLRNFLIINQPHQLMGELFNGVGIQDCFPGYGIAGIAQSVPSLLCQRVVAFGAEAPMNTVLLQNTDGVSKDASGNEVHMCSSGYYIKGYDAAHDWLVCEGKLPFQTQTGIWVSTSTPTGEWVSLDGPQGGTTVFTGIKKTPQGLQYFAVPYPPYDLTNIVYQFGPPPGIPAQ